MRRQIAFTFALIGAASGATSAFAAPTTIYDPTRGLSYYQNTTSLNLADAESAAVSAGGHLVSIHSDLQNAAIIGMGGSGWIGFNDRASEGNFVWTDGTPSDYTHWNTNEPNNSGGFENATEFNGGNWNDNNENNTQGSVYEKPGFTLTATQSNGMKYAVIAATDWDSAESQAVAMGGHLASVHSAADNTFIQSLIPTGQSSVWVGFNDKANEGNFVWTDGTPSDYTNWNNGEPNNSGGNENAAELSTGGWNDLNESTARFAVVEVSAAPEPATAGALILIGSAMGLRRRGR